MEIRLPSGATEAYIVQALANQPNGGTLVLPANETIQIKAGLLVSVTQRDITIDLNGSTLQQAGNVTVISGRGDQRAVAERVARRGWPRPEHAHL